MNMEHMPVDTQDIAESDQVTRTRNNKPRNTQDSLGTNASSVTTKECKGKVTAWIED